MKVFILGSSLAVAQAGLGNWVREDEGVDNTQRVKFFATLRRSGQDEIHRIFRAVSDPSQETYAEFLSWEDAGRLSRPLPEHETSVRDWLALHNVTEYVVHPHGDSLKGYATVGQLSIMTGGTFVNYKNKISGEILARMTDEQFNAMMPEGLETFGGFTNLPAFLSTGGHASRVGGAQDKLVTPQVLRREFDVIPVEPAPGNIHAMAQFESQQYFDADADEFCRRWNVDGDCRVAKLLGKNIGWQFTESSLDLQYLSGAGQAVETWVYSYDETDLCHGFLEMVSDVVSNATFANVISVSYGTQVKGNCKDAIQRSAADVEKLAAMGITVVVASGDYGSGQYPPSVHPHPENCPFPWVGVKCSLTPAWPSTIPAVLAVGSTMFQSESAQGDDCGSCTGPQKATESFGSGGGFSWDYDAQGYQSAAVSSYLGKTTHPRGVKWAQSGRGTPDVALNGAHYAVIQNGTNVTVGGTSAAAPAFASFISLLNAERMKAGKTLGSVNALFYQHPEAFTDITVGTNGVFVDGQGSKPEAGWKCEEGWDAVTGLGTPVFSKLLKIVQDLNAKDFAKSSVFV